VIVMPEPDVEKINEVCLTLSPGAGDGGELNGAPLDTALRAYSGKRILDTGHPE
jgi:hypothetical protein